MNRDSLAGMDTIKRLHFIGIGGVGMSGIAQLCLARGYKVSGSDIKASSMSEVLLRAGAQIHIGHRAENLGDAELIIISSAISATNPELQEAHARGLQIRKRAEVLGWLMSDRYGIAVAGAHGKTTTTSLVSRVLEAGHLDPTLIVGGEVMATKSNVRFGKSSYVVVEADESDASFLYLPAKIAIVTNIDDDHMDHYRTVERMDQTYVDFINNLGPDGLAVLCIDNPRLKGLIPRINVPFLTYGFSEDADVRASDLSWEGRLWSFHVNHLGTDLGRFEISLPGRHNVQNALSSVAVAMKSGVDPVDIRNGLESFTGVKRRFQFVGEAQDISVYDDYAHHPTEIKATLESARLCRPGRLVVLFQPHRFSRTRLLASEFGRSFSDADLVILLPVYAAGESDDGVTSDLIYRELVKNHPYVVAIENNGRELRSLVPLIASQLEAGDWVFTVGAGDVTQLGGMLIKQLQKVVLGGIGADTFPALEVALNT